MMNILEYANDVKRDVEEIFKLCQKLNIKYENEDTLLDEEAIIALDNEIASNDEDLEDYNDDELFEKVENLANDIKISKEVQKTKIKVKKTDSSKDTNFKNDKKEIYKHKEKLISNEKSDNDNIILYENNMSVKDLANKLEISTTEILKKLINLGIMANLNQKLSFDVCEMLVIDYDKTLKKSETQDIVNFEEFEIIDAEENLEERAPVVTIMGHVDHGKTSLLDYIRKTSVVSGEAGGITQAIGAYQVEYCNKNITFIDTPGHEAFTQMRARGASITDIVIIIVAADDGVMPQTKEAIDHAKAAGAPIIVAINKIDKDDADPTRVLSELAEYSLTPEQWGGETITVEISAKTGSGIDNLLENILLVSELQNYRANKNRYATGTVIESRLDKKVGNIATLLIQNGTLRLGDPIVVGTAYGKIRSLKNDKGQDITFAYPSTPVEITGLNELPKAGDKFMAFETEKQARSVMEERKTRLREGDSNKSGMTLEDLFGNIKTGNKELNLILKSDVAGSSEAVKSSISKIDVEDVVVNIIRSSVGSVTESDINLAKASNAIIIAFNIKIDNNISDKAKEEDIEIREYSIIYKLVEDIEKSLKGLLDPIYEEVKKGSLEIRKIFKFSKIGNIAGCHVTNGVIKVNNHAKVIRNDEIVYTGKIKTIQREKDQVKEVSKGMDCGITLDNYQDIREDDIIEVFDLVEVKR